jgi:hypothetical protein
MSPVCSVKVCMVTSSHNSNNVIRLRREGHVIKLIRLRRVTSSHLEHSTCVCLRVCMRVNMALVYTHIHTFIQTNIHTCLHTNIHTYTHIHTRVYMHINHYHRVKCMRPEHARRRNADERAAATPEESMRVLVVDRVRLLGAWGKDQEQDQEQQKEVLDEVQHFTQETSGQLLPLVCHCQACA